MASNELLKVVAGALLAVSHVASAALVPVGVFNGNVGVSIDGIGSNASPVGGVQASVPAGSTILAAYLYSAGTPFPWYAHSPMTLNDYNAAGITLAGTAIDNFSVLVGATSTRPDIGRWFTACADVTVLVQSPVAAGPQPNYSWDMSEGTKYTRIDGGQNTGGETTNVLLGFPLGDPTAPGFKATMSLGISFSTGGTQVSSRRLRALPAALMTGCSLPTAR
jgi:hypothetical protein